MLRTPNSFRFICESCEKPASASQVRRWIGQCKRCQGKSWSLLVRYTDVEVNESLLMKLAIGIGYHIKTSTNELVYDHVSMETAHLLTQIRKEVPSRIAKYVSEREQQHLTSVGGKNCLTCGILFVPIESKPWTAHGCCSRACAKRNGLGDFDSTPPILVSNKVQRRGKRIKAVCPAGHEFEVVASFAGCVRPCSECGAKTQIQS